MEKHATTVLPNTRTRLGEILLQISDDILEAINVALVLFAILISLANFLKMIKKLIAFILLSPIISLANYR